MVPNEWGYIRPESIKVGHDLHVYIPIDTYVYNDAKDLFFNEDTLGILRKEGDNFDLRLPKEGLYSTSDIDKNIMIKINRLCGYSFGYQDDLLTKDLLPIELLKIHKQDNDIRLDIEDTSISQDSNLFEPFLLDNKPANSKIKKTIDLKQNEQGYVHHDAIIVDDSRRMFFDCNAAVYDQPTDTHKNIIMKTEMGYYLILDTTQRFKSVADITKIDKAVLLAEGLYGSNDPILPIDLLDIDLPYMGQSEQNNLSDYLTDAEFVKLLDPEIQYYYKDFIRGDSNFDDVDEEEIEIEKAINAYEERQEREFYPSEYL